jgi:hypothetical protein
MITGMDREKKPKPRWKTISLRALLLIVLAIALWLGWIVNKAREQREAVRALQKFGGFVHYDWEFVNGRVKVPQGNLLWMPSWGKFTPGGKPWAPDWLRRALGDEYFQSIAHVSLYVDIKNQVASATWVNMGPADDALRKLATQTSIRTLQIGGQQVTDANLSYVGQMTGLQELSIAWGRHLTDRGFMQLSRLKRVRILEVDNSKMTDAGLEAIGKLTNLEELRIGGAGFSDRGLAQLKGLTRLKTLWFVHGDHQISDASVESLKSMPALEDLAVVGWHVSDEGIAKLRELKNLKTLIIGLSKDQQVRKDRLHRLLPGLLIE